MEIASPRGERTAPRWCESPGSIQWKCRTCRRSRRRRIEWARRWRSTTPTRPAYPSTLRARHRHREQALTKYVGGHSDILLGSVTVGRADYERVRRRDAGARDVRIARRVQPALRGMQTLAVRHVRVERSTLDVATWLAQRPRDSARAASRAAFASGHELWRRDFTGSTRAYSRRSSRRRTGVCGCRNSSMRFSCSRSAGAGAVSATSLAVPVNPPRTVATRPRRRARPVQYRSRGAGGTLISDLEQGLAQCGLTTRGSQAWGTCGSANVHICSIMRNCSGVTVPWMVECCVLRKADFGKKTCLDKGFPDS